MAIGREVCSCGAQHEHISLSTAYGSVGQCVESALLAQGIHEVLLRAGYAHRAAAGESDRKVSSCETAQLGETDFV
jgi:hypothetical protein